MGYWPTILRQTAKRAADPLRIGSTAGIITQLLAQFAIGLGLYYFQAKGGAGISTRIVSFFAPFVLFPFYFVWFLVSTIRKKDAESAAEIIRLNKRISELEMEGQSDISIYVDLNHVIHCHPDHKTMHSYSVVIENMGPNYLTNCILKLSTVNKFNLALHDRTWLHDASATFDLRPGQVERLSILWVEAEDPVAPAYPHYHRTDQPELWPETEGEILTADQTHFLFCEVLSANTVPARLTLRVWNGGEGWEMEALTASERPSFDR